MKLTEETGVNIPAAFKARIAEIRPLHHWFHHSIVCPMSLGVANRLCDVARLDFIGVHDLTSRARNLRDVWFGCREDFLQYPTVDECLEDLGCVLSREPEAERCQCDI
jgi:hypothetical protein